MSVPHHPSWDWHSPLVSAWAACAQQLDYLSHPSMSMWATAGPFSLPSLTVTPSPWHEAPLSSNPTVLLTAQPGAPHLFGASSSPGPRDKTFESFLRTVLPGATQKLHRIPLEANCRKIQLGNHKTKSVLESHLSLLWL